MCELLVRYAPREKGTLRHEQGDVLVIVPDDHPWTVLDLGLGARRVIKLPGVDPESVRQFMHEVTDAQGKLARRRGRGLNLESGELAKRLQQSQIITLSKDEHSVFDKASVTRSRK